MKKIKDEISRKDLLFNGETVNREWREDSRFLAYEYKRRNPEDDFKSIKNKVYSKLEYSEHFNRFNKEHIEYAHKNIRLGIRMADEYNEDSSPYKVEKLRNISRVCVDKSVLDYIKNNTIADNGRTDRNSTRIIFTFYIWHKILNASTIMPESDWSEFKKNTTATHIDESENFEKAINFLKNKDMIVENEEAKMNSDDGNRRFFLNFGVAAPEELVIHPLINNDGEFEETPKEYLLRIDSIISKDRIYDANNTTYDFITVLDPKIKSIPAKDKYGNDIEGKYRAVGIKVLPQEYEYYCNMAGIENNFTIIPSSKIILKVRGPEEYTTELVDSKKYTDYLHKPGIFIERFIFGTARCKDCGERIPKVDEFKVKGKYKCNRCKREESKKNKKEERRKIIKESERFDYFAYCPYCGRKIKVKKDDENWEKYRSNSIPCKECLREAKVKVKPVKVNCAICGNEYSISKNLGIEEFYEVKNHHLPALCPKCRKRITNKINDIKSKTDIEVGLYDYARAEIKVRNKKSAVTGITGFKNLNKKDLLDIEELIIERLNKED